MSTNLAPLLSKGIDKNTYLELKDYPPTGIKAFHLEDTSYPYIDHQTWGGYNKPSLKPLGTPVAFGQFFPNFSMRYYIRTYALGDVFPMELLKDDMYGAIHKVIPRKGGLFARAFVDLVEYDLAAYFTTGFATGTIQGTPDGVGLFSALHPTSTINTATTISNQPSIAMDFSVALAQVASTALKTQQYPNAQTYIRNRVKQCWYNPKYDYLAKQVYRSNWYPDTADRDVNYLRDDNVEMMSWPYWTRSGPTGTNNSTFFIGEEHELYFYLRAPMTVETQSDVNTLSEIIVAYTRHAFGHSDWRGTFGSPGL